MLQEHRYHFHTAKYGQKVCIENRRIALSRALHDITTIRDYAEHLAAQFKEI